MEQSLEQVSALDQLFTTLGGALEPVLRLQEGVMAEEGGETLYYSIPSDR